MPTSVELFAGGGGLALGLHAAGFEHEQLVELSPSAYAVLRENAARNPRLWKSENIRQMDVREWLSEIPALGLPPIDLVAGGPPCQPFSISGKRAGVDDNRDLFPAAVEAVRALQPKLFLFENVPGLLGPGFRPYYDYIQDCLARPDVRPKVNEGWQTHHNRIRSSRSAELRYHVFRQEINAADLGVPQIRKRVFIVGFREDVMEREAWRPIKSTHSRDALLRAQWVNGDYWDRHGVKPPSSVPDSFKVRVRRLRDQTRNPSAVIADSTIEPHAWVTVRDAVSSLPEPLDNVEDDEFANHWGIPNARIYKGHTGSPYDWPAKALKAGGHGVCGGEAMIRFHFSVRKRGNQLRYLTIREAARIQTFPDEYVLPGSRTAAMRAIGNAVAVDVAKTLGAHLIRLSDLGDTTQD